MSAERLTSRAAALRVTAQVIDLGPPWPHFTWQERKKSYVSARHNRAWMHH